MTTERAIEYLVDRHKAVARQFDHYTSPGHGCPGFAEQLSREMRGLEQSIIAAARAFEQTTER